MSAESPNQSMQWNLSTTSMQRTRGFTLIEVMLVLALVTTLLASTVSLMTVVKRSDRQAKRSSQNRQDIRRFVDDVRRDIRRATNVQIQDKDVLITYASQSPQTLYEIRPDAMIARAITDSKKDSVYQETYQVGIEAETEIDVQWIKEDRIIQWTITETNRKSKPMVIMAALGSESR